MTCAWYSLSMNNDQTPTPVPESETPAEQPLKQPVDTTQSTPVAPKSNKPLLITLVTLAGLFIALAAMYLFYYLPNKSEETPSKATTHEVHSMTAEEVTTTINTYLRDDLGHEVKMEQGTSPAYKPANSPTYVATTDIPASVAAPDTTTEETDFGTPLREKVAAHLKSLHHFKDTTTKDLRDSTTELQSDDVICTVTSTMMGITTTCEDKVAYTKLASDLRPLGLALASKDKNTVLSGLEMKDSQTADYQLATVNVTSYNNYGGAMGLFYKDASNSGWKFFKTSQSILQCSDYDTDDLKNAYYGAVCLSDNNVESNVAPAKVE